MQKVLLNATNSLDKFLDESVLEPILESPQTLTSLGLHQLDFLTNHNENLDDYSVEKSELDHEKFLVYYEKLNNFDETQLPNSAKLNLEVAKFAANIEKRGFENFRYYMGPFIQFYGTHLSFVNFMTDTHKLVSEKDAEDYISVYQRSQMPLSSSWYLRKEEPKLASIRQNLCMRRPYYNLLP